MERLTLVTDEQKNTSDRAANTNGILNAINTWSISTKVISAFSMPIILMTIVSTMVYYRIDSQIHTAHWVQHTQHVINKAHMLENLLLDMEGSKRSYIITGNNSFLAPFYTAKRRWSVDAQQLTILVGDNPQQVRRLQDIDAKTQEWLQQSEDKEILTRSQSVPEANDQSNVQSETERLENSTFIQPEPSNKSIRNQSEAARLDSIVQYIAGKNLIDSIRSDIASFIEMEEQLIKKRGFTAEIAASKTVDQTIFGAIISIILTAVAAAYLLKIILLSIKTISDATTRVAKGDYTASIDIENDDQFGTLAASFNKMTTKLTNIRAAMEDTFTDLELQTLNLENQKNEIAEQNSDLLEAQKKLIKYADELEKSNQYKSEFLAMMSHEIRTPMNGIFGMLDLLRNSKLSDDQSRKVNMAKTSADSLLSIINDILDFSKIDAGKMDIEVIDFDLIDLLSGVSGSAALTAHKKNVEVIINTIDVNQTRVKGDPHRIRQVITNLLSNALKFTEQGEIVVRASLTLNENNDFLLTCSVKDSGIGIPKDKQVNLFEAFRQVDASTTREYGGTGLGLTIVKKLCQLMGGDITVSSLDQHGSVFEFTLPLLQSHQSTIIQPAEPVDEVRVLLVENNITNQKCIQQQLERWGAKVKSASNILAAKKLLQQSTGSDFDLILIDSELAVIDDQAFFTNTMLAIEDKQQTTTVVMSSMANGKDSTYYTKLGFSGFFHRPTTQACLFYALQLSQHEHDVTEAAEHEETAEEHHLEWTENHRILLVEDNSINQALVTFMLEDLSLDYDIADNGEEALKALNSNGEDFPYSLILMDCQMPVMDGYTATKHIRFGDAAEHYKNIPIIALTANAMKGDADACYAAGMSDYLSKPIDLDTMTAMLEKWLNPDNKRRHKHIPSNADGATG